MIWVAGNRKKGVSVSKVRGSRVWREGVKRKWAWAVGVWMNGKLVGQPEYYPTKKEALQEAKGRARIGWYG